MPDKTEPNIIYHYTTFEGLMGILRKNVLWATKIQYLNDATELVEPINIADNLLNTYLNQIYKGLIKNIKPQIIEHLSAAIHEWQYINICVCSFCTNGDLLSQWRGYGVPGSAYSIGFNREKLLESIKSHPFELKRCTYYDPTEYRKTVQEFIMHVIEESRNKDDMPEDFIGRFIRMASSIKLKCFEEEDEWRIVSYEPLSFSDDRFDFRVGESMMVPFYSLPIDLSSIVQIIIGPCPHPEPSKASIDGLAHKFGLDEVQKGQVKISQIPYRNF